ncbi:hypothetical protein [Haliangium sp.]|uniref:hypothetical protein n=1 Tax=Haliangium sp. TaxID=2663208 RepID=UPI003D145C31
MCTSPSAVARAGLALGLALLCSACAGQTPSPAAPTPAAPSPTEVLRLPVPADAAAQDSIVDALSELAARAQGQGPEAVAAAWTRSHYLLDLFDDARFRPDEASRAMLHRALGTAAEAPTTGPAATTAVASALLVGVDEILAGERLHPDAVAARTLLRFDLEPPRARAQVHERMAPIEAIAGAGGPLADNARLRLIGYCRTALADAAAGPRRDRGRILAHCLYPLYEADPEAYFSADPGARPPPPQALALARDLDRLAARVADDGGRLAVTGAAVREGLAALAQEIAPALADMPDPVALGLARADAAQPYDGAPIVALSRTEAARVPGALAVDEADRLARAVATDGRARVAALVPAVEPATRVLEAAAGARRAGATTLGLLAWRQQRVQVPAGDYWSRRLPPDRRVRRLAEIGLALDENGPGTLGLHLVVGRATWQLVSPAGALAPVTTEGADTTAGEDLAVQLAGLMDAFGGLDGLALVPTPDATAGALVAAAGAALGAVGELRLRLASAAPVAVAGTGANALALRIERRARARVAIEPTALSEHAGAVRACYQALLERRPGLTGVLRLERRAGAVRVTAGPAERGLRACVQAALAEPMALSDVSAVAVTLELAEPAGP